jgi:hypothetical protein
MYVKKRDVTDFKETHGIRRLMLLPLEIAMILDLKVVPILICGWFLS